MTSLVFPSSWSSLKHPHVRWELLEELAELADPHQTARWLAPDPNGPVIGIDQTVHFFFDDHDFDLSEIGCSLFDEAEVRVVAVVLDAITQVIGPGKALASNREILSHPAWPQVEQAARDALDRLLTCDAPINQETNP